MTKDRFGEAIGIWHLDIGGADIDLKPTMGDNRKLRKILMDDQLRKDKPLLMDKFDDFLFELIKRAYPDDSDERIKEYIEYNSQELFEDTLIKFRWSTKSDLEKAKEQVTKDLKKLTGGD